MYYTLIWLCQTLLCPHRGRGTAAESRAEEGPLQWWHFLSCVLLDENTTNGTTIAACVCTESVLSSPLCARQTSWGSVQNRKKDTSKKQYCMLPGFVKGELCQKNLISYQRKLIDFSCKGNMADLTISKAFNMMPHGKLLIQWGMMGLGRRTMCGGLAEEGMNTSDVGEGMIRLEEGIVCAVAQGIILGLILLNIFSMAS